MNSIDLIGLAAGTLTTVSFLPQVLKIWRSKSGRDISFWMFLLFSCGVLLWLTYGLLLGAAPVVVANAVTLLLALCVLILKLYYDRKPVRE